MSKKSELRNLYNSFSYDAPQTMHSRAGDEVGAVNTQLDLLASTQSAEADIIEAEERAERRGTQRKFMQLLELYLKKILAPVEFKFFALSVRTAETPYAVGRALGLNYETAIETITAKYAANFSKLLRLLRAYGYGEAVYGFEFMPQWRRYVEIMRRARASSARFQADNHDRFRELQREWYRKKCQDPEYREARRKYQRERSNRLLLDPEYRAAYNAKQREWRERNREAVNEKQRIWRAANRESINARNRERYREYYQNPEHREAKRAYDREASRRRTADPEKRAAINERARQAARLRRERNRAAVNEKQRIWRAANAEHVRALRREHYQKHREEIRAKVNARRAAQRAADPEAFRAKRREERRRARERNREAINERQKQYYAAHRERLQAYQREYYYKNRANARKEVQV